MSDKLDELKKIYPEKFVREEEAFRTLSAAGIVFLSVPAAGSPSI